MEYIWMRKKDDELMYYKYRLLPHVSRKIYTKRDGYLVAFELETYVKLHGDKEGEYVAHPVDRWVFVDILTLLEDFEYIGKEKDKEDSEEDSEDSEEDITPQQENIQTDTVENIADFYGDIMGPPLVDSSIKEIVTNKATSIRDCKFLFNEQLKPIQISK